MPSLVEGRHNIRYLALPTSLFPFFSQLRRLAKLLSCKATEQRSSSAIDFQWRHGSRGKDHPSERICKPRMMKEASALTQGPRRGGNAGHKFLDSQWPRRPKLSFLMGAWGNRRPMFCLWEHGPKISSSARTRLLQSAFSWKCAQFIISRIVQSRILVCGIPSSSQMWELQRAAGNEVAASHIG